MLQEIVEPKWTGQDFFAEVDAMMPPWREPVPGLASGAVKSCVFPEESAVPGQRVHARAYAAVTTTVDEQEYGAGEEMPGTFTQPLTMYVRMIDPAGNLMPVFVKSCVVPLEDTTDYGREHLRRKLDQKWLLAERQAVAFYFGFLSQKADKEHGEFLRKEMMKRRRKQLADTQKEEAAFHKRADAIAQKQLEKQGEVMTRVVKETLAAAQGSQISEERIAQIVAQTMAAGAAALAAPAGKSK